MRILGGVLGFAVEACEPQNIPVPKISDFSSAFRILINRGIKYW
jgi:hypothetical protein